MTPNNIVDQLLRDEGERLKMYLDSRGVPTIGVGHNLRDKAISKRASRTILEDDINDATSGLVTALPWVLALDEVRKGALQNMAFNLGVQGLLEFKKALAYMQQGAYQNAAGEFLNSAWAEQVGPRAHRLAQQIASGQWV